MLCENAVGNGLREWIPVIRKEKPVLIELLELRRMELLTFKANTLEYLLNNVLSPIGLFKLNIVSAISSFGRRRLRPADR